MRNKMMMETFTRIRMDILVEAPLKARIARLLDEEGVSGYTIFSALGGRGADALWARAGHITEVGQMLNFVCIVDLDRREPILNLLIERYADQIGFVTTSEVQVIRPTKFS